LLPRVGRWSTTGIRVTLFSLLLALLPSLGASAFAAPDAFKKQLQAHKKSAKDPSFFRRMRAHEALARTKDVRALKVLAKVYGRPPEPRDQSQYWLAAACGRHFNAPVFLPELLKWRKRLARPEHAWLWYQTLLIQAQNDGAADVVALAHSTKSGFLRAAAVEVLSALRLPHAVGVVPGMLATLPKDKCQRIAMLNCLAGVLLSTSHEDGSPSHHGLARQLIDQLDRPTTPAESKVVIARALQRVFDVPHAFTQSAPWRQVLASVQSLMEIPPLRGKEVPPVQVGGVKARGQRIVYLLDLSANARAAATPEDLAILAGRDPNSADAPKQDTLRVLAMREALRASLEALTPEQSFSVLYHRHLDSDFVPGCKGMMPATAKNVGAVLLGLKTLEPKHDSDLHAGLMRAFAVTEKGLAKKYEYVDPDALLQGCDTVFVLTQSGSVRDTWVPAGDAPNDPVHYSYEDREIRGIYSDEAYLAEELRRWNLFRKAQIHAVAIGDAPREALLTVLRPFRGWNTLKETEARAIDADAANEIFSAVKRQYDAYMKRPSLFMRMRGRTRLARTRDARALDVLAKNYANPEPPQWRIPHILISLCSRHFAKPEHLPRFRAWRKKHDDARDAWLWFRTAQLELKNGDPGAVEALARKGGGHYLRLAAARAIASQRKPNCVPLAGELLVGLPEEANERATTLEAVAALLRARGHMRGAEDFAAPCEALIGHLKDAKVALRTRQVIVRNLAKIFRTDTGHGLDADRWIRELRGAQGVPEPAEEPPDLYAPFEFIGIPSAGGRVCYVVDASDSMLEPITDVERRELSRVVTGAGPEKDEKDALPWDRIHNRFDVAREYLKLSLRKLNKEKSFAIVLFGTEAEPLPSTEALVVATPETVRRAIKDLDAIKPGPKQPGRPHGTLRGFTNMHGGLDLAFRITGKGLGAKDPYVDPKMLARGVDTIFLLSDGDPSMDDYAAVDRPDAGDLQADPETRAAQEKVPDVTFYGPYVDFDGYLIDDVRRMNLFRNAAIHCIGIGEADMLLLREIAGAGMGETKKLGLKE